MYVLPIDYTFDFDNDDDDDDGTHVYDIADVLSIQGILSITRNINFNISCKLCNISSINKYCCPHAFKNQD